MTETAEMQAKPVAWRYRSNAPKARWTVQKNFPAPVEKWDGYSVEPLYSQSDFDAMRAQRDEAIRLLRQVSLVLESLTPGGSEYISHSKVLDAYYADADACCRFVKEQKADGHKARIEAVDERRRNAALQAQITRLREALKPFAEYMNDGGDLDDKECPLTDDQGPGWVYLTTADFRRARAALSEPSPSNSGDTPNA